MKPEVIMIPMVRSVLIAQLSMGGGMVMQRTARGDRISVKACHSENQVEPSEDESSEGVGAVILLPS